MKKQILRFLLVVLILMCNQMMPVFSQSFVCTIQNEVQVSSNILEFDLYLLNVNPAIPVKFADLQAGIVVNPDIENSGQISANLVSGSSQIALGGVPAIRYEDHCVKIASTFPPDYDKATVLSTTGKGQLFYKVRLTNTVAFTNKSKAGLGFCYVANQPYQTKMAYFETSTKLSLIIGDATNCYTETDDIVLLSNKLSISNPNLALQKVYDGTATATVTPGELSGMNAGDETKVGVTATATYDNANAGKGKTITVKYKLTGEAANQYLAPDSFVVNTAVILPKAIDAAQVAITTSKVYDSFTTAATSVGKLSEILSSDVSNVSLTVNANYMTTMVGTGKSILVNYLLTGSLAYNYSIIKDSIIANAEIIAKQLVISDPDVVKIKMYDETTSAKINSLGTVEGILAADKVVVSAVANYENNSVGNNKKIIVSYSLNGIDMANYIAPKNDTIYDASITDRITLSPLQNISSGCGGNEMTLDYTILTGKATQYRIIYGTNAIAAGMTNTDYLNLPTTNAQGSVNITLPANIPAGQYDAMIQLRNEQGNESPVYSFSFGVNLSSNLIVKKYADVLILDNSSKQFVSYQWYKNGTAIEGATLQFYNDVNGLDGAYSVKVTTVSGQTYFTCAKEFVKQAGAKQVKVLPNPVKRNESTRICLNGFADKELEGARMSIYTAQGICIYESVSVQLVNTVMIRCDSQLCIGRVVLADGSEHVFKILFE